MNNPLWISVDDRVPDDYRDVWVSWESDNEGVGIGYRCGDKWWRGRNQLFCITHWAEIEKPEPPRRLARVELVGTTHTPGLSPWTQVYNRDIHIADIRATGFAEGTRVSVIMEKYSPEMSGEPARVEIAGVVTDIDFSRPHWMDIRSSHGNIYIPDSAGKFTVGNRVRITVEEME